MKRLKSFDELSSVDSLGTDGDAISVLQTGAKDRESRLDDDELQSGPGLEAGLFGVLYTLKKEPVACGWVSSVLRLVLDPLQQLAVLLNPTFGWYAWMDWPGLGWIWDGLSYLDFARKIGHNASYAVYVGVLYAFGGLLLLVLGACVYIGVTLRRNHLMQLKNTWIVWLTTHTVTLLLQTLFVANMGIPLLSLYCHWLVPSSSSDAGNSASAAAHNSTTNSTTPGVDASAYVNMTTLVNATLTFTNATYANGTSTDTTQADNTYRRGYMHYYPDRSCSAFPQVLNLVLGVLIAVLYGLMTALFTAADVDTNPLTGRLLAAVNPRVELFNLVAKSVFLLAGNVVVTDIPQFQALIFAACMAVQTYTVIRWLPHTVRLTNYLRAGFKLGLTWVAILMVVLRFTQEKGDLTGSGTKRITCIMLIGLPCMVVVGCLLARFRLHRWYFLAMRAFRNLPDSMKPKDVYKFWDVYEVEMVSRACRTPGDIRGTQNARMLKYTDRILRAGIALFPNSAYTHILYANFLIEVQSLYQAGQSQLMAARKQTPNFPERYALFMRQQQHMQRAHTSTTGESAVDLVSYVEFQRNYRLLLRATTRALLAQQAFWRLLRHSTLQFNTLTSAFRNIEAAQEAALKTYRSVLERYPNSVKLLRSYAHFQEEVMNNPWRAAQIYEKADKLEEQQAAAQDYLLYANDSSMLTQVDDRNNAVAVINSSGIIQMTNKPLQKMFSYKASELEGQNVSILMPAPYCNRHNGYLASYVSTGQSKVVETVREVVALHRRRHVFPIKLAVSKLSGQGADSQFLGVIRPVEANAKVVRAYVMYNGITLCVEDRFEDMFGISPAECIGRPFKDLVVEQDEVQSLMTSVREAAGTGATAPLVPATGSACIRLHVQHKYAAPVLVELKITPGGTPDEPLHILSLTPIASQTSGGTSAGGAGTAAPYSSASALGTGTSALMVFNRGGNVVFASSSASAMLGYAHKSFLLMNLEALLPEHFKSLHAIGMRDLMARKAAHSCRSGQTVFMAASNKALVPVRLSISHKAEGDDNLLTVVEAVRSSVDAGLDERRVKLEVGPTGEVLSVLSPASPVSLLGVAPAALVGANLFKLVPELGAAAPTEQLQEEAVEELRALCMKRLAPAYLRVVMGGGSATAAAAVPAFGDAKAAAAATGAADANLAGPGPAGIRPQVSELLAVIPEASEAAAEPARGADAAAVGPQGMVLGDGDSEEHLLQTAAAAAAAFHTGGPARRFPAPAAAAHAAVAEVVSATSAVPSRAAATPQAMKPVAAECGDAGTSPGGCASAAGQQVSLNGIAIHPGSKAASGPGPIPAAADSAAGPVVGPAPSKAELPSGAAALARLFSAGRRARTATAGATATAASTGFAVGQTSQSGALKPSLLRSGRDVGRRRQGAGVLGLLPRAVILEIDGTGGDAHLVVSIWHPDKVASVLEVSRDGDIRQAVLDELHPPGPLFGVSPAQLLQHNLKDVLGLSPRQSLLQYFYTSGNTISSRGSAGSLAQQAQQLQQQQPLEETGASAGHPGRRRPFDSSDLSSGGGADVNCTGAPGTGAARRARGPEPVSSAGAPLAAATKGVVIAASGGAGAAAGASSSNGASLLSRRLPSPLVHVTTTHADGRPLHLLVQAMPRRNSSQTLYLRLHLMPNAAHVQLSDAALVPAGPLVGVGGGQAGAVSMSAGGGGISSRLAGLFGAGVLAPLVSRSPALPAASTADPMGVTAGAVSFAQSGFDGRAPQGTAGAALQPTQSAPVTPANASARVGSGPAAGLQTTGGLRVAPSAPAPYALPYSTASASTRRQALMQGPSGCSAEPLDGTRPHTAAAAGAAAQANALPAGFSCRIDGSGIGGGEGGAGRTSGRGALALPSWSGSGGKGDGAQLSGVAMFSNHLFQMDASDGRAVADGRTSDEEVALGGHERGRKTAQQPHNLRRLPASVRGSSSTPRASELGIAPAEPAAAASPVVDAPRSQRSIIPSSEDADPYDTTDVSERESDGDARAQAFELLGPAVDEAGACSGCGAGDGSDSGDSTVRALRKTVVAPLAAIGRRTMRRGLDTGTSAGPAVALETMYSTHHARKHDFPDSTEIHVASGSAPLSDEHLHITAVPGVAGLAPVSLAVGPATGEEAAAEAAAASGHEQRPAQSRLHDHFRQPAHALAPVAVSADQLPCTVDLGSDGASVAAAGAAAATYSANMVGGRSRTLEQQIEAAAAASGGSVTRLSEMALRRLARAAETDTASGKQTPRSVRHREQLGGNGDGDDPASDIAARSSLTRRWIQSTGAAVHPGRGAHDAFDPPAGSGAEFEGAGKYSHTRPGLLEPAALPLDSPVRTSREPGRRGGPGMAAAGAGGAAVDVAVGARAQAPGGDWYELTPGDDTDGQGQLRQQHQPQPPVGLPQASSRRLTRRTAAAVASAASAPATAAAGGGVGDASPPGSEADNDDRSSSYSGAPGAGPAEAEDEERHLDFQRGKRLRRILKILERPESRKPITRFWQQSRVISLLLFLSHLGCFIGIMVLLGDLKSCVSDIAASGLALEELHSAALASRVLDQMHKNKTVDTLYKKTDMSVYEQMMYRSTAGFEERFVPAYRSFVAKHPQHRKTLTSWWDDRVYLVEMKSASMASGVHDTSTDAKQYMSLFEMGNWFQAYATYIAGNHNFTVQDLGYNLSDTRGFEFIHHDAVFQLTDAYIKVLDTNVEDCVDIASLTNNVMLSLLIVEACCICGSAAVYIMWRLMQVTRWRCALFGVFLGVPNPSIRALASRKIAEEYDEDSTVVEGQLDAADKDQALVQQQKSAAGPGLDNKSAAGISAKGTEPPQQSKDMTGGSGPADRGTAAPGPATGGGGGDSGPSPRADLGGARNNWASPGPSRLRASFRDFAPPGQGSVSERGPDGVAGGTGARRRATATAFTNRYGAGQVEASGPTPGVLAAAAGAGATNKVAAAPSSPRLSWRQRAAAWQESVVRFFRMQYQRPGSRKVLAYNSVRNWWLCLPVVIWAVLIITLYAVSYTLVTNLYEPIETVNIASFVVMRNTRLVYFAHELCVLSDPTLIPAYRRSLSDRRVVAGVEYDVLLYGNKYYTPALLANMSTGVHRIGKSSGIISATSSIQNLLFFTRECLRADPSTCVSRGNPLFQATHSGVNALVSTLFQVCDLLLDAPDSEVNQSSPYLATLFQIGLNDARDGLLSVQAYYIDEMNNRIFRIASLQIGLMVALLPLLVVFVFYLVRPFVQHIKEERNRMAIMLSELPQDADIVRMVEDAVGLGRAAAEARRKAKEAKQHAKKASALAAVRAHETSKRPGLVPLPTGSFRW